MRFVQLFIGGLLLALAFFPGTEGVSEATPGQIDLVAIDMEEEATPTNTNNSVGSIETCRRMNRNGILDADEDLVNRLLVDVVLPAPGFDPSDGGSGYAYNLTYPPGHIQVVAGTPEHLIQHDGFYLWDPPFDADGDWRVEFAEVGGNADDGPGILTRITIQAVGSPAASFHPLRLTDNVELDDMINPLAYNGAPLFVAAQQDAFVALDTPCAADTDGDAVPDPADNCPTTPNENQANSDGDPFGNACELANCVNFATAWTTPTGDTDCDGFPDTVTVGARGRENLMATDPADRCADTTVPNDEEGPAVGEPLSPWPPDFNDTRTANVSDIVMFGDSFNSVGPNPPYNARFDLNASNGVNMSDVVIIGPFYNKNCTP